jgi:hypothetical protein
MATTTPTTYTIVLSISDNRATPSAVGRALYDAMAGMPDEPMDYEFDSFHQGAGAEQRTLDLPLVFEAPDHSRLNLGMAYLMLGEAIPDADAADAEDYAEAERLSKESTFEQQILRDGR